MANSEFKVIGMKCGGCEKTVQTAINAVPGVLASRARSSDGSVEVEYDAVKTNVEAIQKAVVAAGFPLA